MVSTRTGTRWEACTPSQVMNPSHDQASRITAAPAMVPAIRPAWRLRIVWLMNICSWTRQSSRPSARPSHEPAPDLAFEATQYRADVVLAAAGQLEEDLLQRLPVLPDHVPEVLQAAHRYQAAVVDDGQPGAHPLGDFEDVSGKEDSLPLTAEVLQDVFHLSGALRIEADGRLIKEEDLRVVQQRRRQRDFLPHAARIAREEVVAALPEIEQVQQRRDPAIAKPALNMVEIAGEFEELAGAELVVEGGGVRHVADQRLGFLRLGRNVDPGHPGVAAARSQQAHEHLDGGCLAGPVGTEEAEQLPGAHLQVQVLYRREAAVALGQEAGGQHRAQSTDGSPKPGLEWASWRASGSNTARIQGVAQAPRQVFRRYSVVALKVKPCLQSPDSIDGGRTAGRRARRPGQQPGVRPDGRPLCGDDRPAAAGLRPRRASADGGRGLSPVLPAPAGTQGLPALQRSRVPQARRGNHRRLQVGRGALHRSGRQ